MDSYKIGWKSSAKKAIGNILSAIEALPNDLHPTGSKKVIGTEHTYRQRLGNYRIVYSIEKNYLTIEIIRVGHRKSIYRKIT